MRIFGIRIGVDVSWFLVLFLIIWSLSGYYDDLFPGEDTKSFVLAVISALLFFLSILLHEMGHAVVAMRNGIPISGIDLFLFGGVAKMERDTTSPGVEFRVSAAGPVVTLVIAALCYAAAVLAGGGGDAEDALTFQVGQTSEVVAVLGYLAFINALLLVFNLIPGFPLDGGRIARAIAWKITGDRNKATNFAAVLGRGFGYLLIALGAWRVLTGDLISGVWFVFIGIFLGQAARSAQVQAAFSTRLGGLRAADVMDADPVAVPEGTDLERAWDEYFLRYGWPWFPVVDGEGRLVGVLAREAVEGVGQAERPTTTAASVMARVDAASGMRVRTDEPLEDLFGRDGLARLGALLAVDADGVLRGIVTVDRVRRAVRGATA